jgi:hypothetical protein
MASKSSAVNAYLEALPAQRREVLSTVRDVVVRNLPKGYEESMNYGMINYTVPLERYPDTYNGQPLCYAGLAAQKNHFSLYLLGAYGDPRQVKKIETEFKKRGLKLDMGKSCLRFRKLEDIPLDVVGEMIASTPPADFIKTYEKSRKKK